MTLSDGINGPQVSHDALSGMPGDEIYYDSDSGVKKARIMTAGWQPTPNGGKVWTYETTDAILVPNHAVREVHKRPRPSVSDEMSALEFIGSVSDVKVYSTQEFMKALDMIDISAAIKTAIFCALEDDKENLKVAVFLLKKRLKALEELSN